MTHHLIWLCLLCRWNTGSRTFEQNWIIGCQGWCPVGTRWALPMCPIGGPFANLTLDDCDTVWLWYRVNSCIAPNCPSGRLTHSSSVYGYSNENTVYSNVYSIQLWVSQSVFYILNWHLQTHIGVSYRFFSVYTACNDEWLMLNFSQLAFYLHSADSRAGVKV